MAGIVKKTGGGNRINQMVKHLKYIGFRSREVEKHERGFFDEKYDKGVDYKSFVKSIVDNKALKHPSTNKYHKFVFSLSSWEYKNSNRDYKDIIRSTIGRYEKEHNIKLNWIGSFHEAEKHPHCHIVISGASQKLPDGTYKRIYFNKDDFKELRQDFQMEVDRDKTMTFVQNQNFREGASIVSAMFEQALKEMQKQAEIESQEQQREREK